MGHSSEVHGYILGDGDYAEHNRARIAALPENDTWPYLTRDLFAIPRPEHSYESHLISFGTVYNGVESAWEAWLGKFEALLRTLYWSDAHVYLQTELWGSHHYVWKSVRSAEEVNEGISGPVHTWAFSGGPRTGLRDKRADFNSQD